MPSRLLLSICATVFVAGAGPFVGTPAYGPSDDAFVALRAAHVRLAEVIETEEIGLAAPTGVTFSPESGQLLVTGTSIDGQPVIAVLGPHGSLESLEPLPAAVANAGLVYDPAGESLVTPPTDDGLLIVSAPAGDVSGEQSRAVPVDSRTLGTPDGLTVSTDGDALVLDAEANRVVNLGAPDDTPSVESELPLTGAGSRLSGLAAAPDGTLFTLDESASTILEFDTAGALRATRDISDVALTAPAALAVAPSGDQTDDPAEQSLYVAEAGSGASDGGVYEFELTATELAPGAVAAVTDTASLVRMTEGSALTPGSPDPSGIAYNPANDRLVMVDGEIDEEGVNDYPYPGTNGWVFPRNGSATTATFDTTDDDCGLVANVEPVGITRNPADGHWFISRDGAQQNIYELDASFNYLSCFETASFGVGDAEGLTFAAGHLFIAGGADGQIYRLSPGGDGDWGTGDDTLLDSFDTESLGVRDPEGIEYNAASGTLYVVSNDDDGNIRELTLSGDVVRNIDVTGVTLMAPRGLGLAPGTNGSPMNLYIADARVDNNDNGGAVDGSIYEFDLGGGTPAPDTTITGGPSGTVSSTGATFTFTGTSATSFECRLDGGAFTTCVSPTAYSGLGEGSHTFRVRAIGPGGTDGTPSTRTWTIDLGGSPPPPDDTPFTDTIGHPFELDISWLYDEGITGGCTATTFCPDSTVLRDQMASFLDRALNLPTTTTDFFDDDDGNIHEAAINRLAASGITGGCDVREYCPRASVRRDQMASFLSRAFELGPTATDFFTDDAGNLHEVQINRLAASGITGGCAPGRYCPTQLVTRGQMAAFLHRAMVN